MGNLFSSNNKFNELQHRLQTLEGLDKNRDGLITKDEFDDWKKRQQADLDMFRETIVKMKDQEYHEKLLDYQKQLETLQEINKNLEKKLCDISIEANEVPITKTTKTNNTQVFSELSKQKIHEAVDRMIDNDAVNVKYLPDFVERQIYKNVFNIILGLLTEFVGGSSIELLGHEITLAINAKLDKKLDEEPDEELEDN